ncbi:MAG: ASPIC/UnbV domain-containing protein [Planctomycetota bacterium]
MSSNQSGPIGAVELEAAAGRAVGQPESQSDGSGVQVKGAHRMLHEMVARGGSFSGRERNCAFLNTRDGEFASSASAVGFDFLDDARAVVTLDYDGDGDVDLITANRTAPRLRVLLNRSERLLGSDRPRAMTLELRGDAPGDSVGATIEIKLKNAPSIVRTTAIGSGFLGASSQRLTVGLGSGPVIEGVRVTWATGDVEAFGGVAVGGAFTLNKGTGEARPLALARFALDASAPSLEATHEGPGCEGSAVSAFLTTPEPLPPIVRNGEPFAWRDPDLEPHALMDPVRKEPRVVVLWSLDCALCARELQGWQIRGASFPTLALSVDEVVAAAQGDTFDFTRLDTYLAAWPEDGPRKIQFGLATYELLNAVQTAVDRPFARDEDLSLPATLVFDQEGRLAAVHRGLVQDEVIAENLAFLSGELASDPEARRRAAVPFEGRWLAPPPRTSTVAIARAWLDAGAAEAAAEALLSAAERGEFSATSPLARPASRAAAEAARLLFEKGDLAHAIPAATLTTDLRPDWPKGHFNRGTMLDAAGETALAEAAYTRVLSIRPKYWQALANRGLLRARTGRKDLGIEDLRAAIKALPASAPEAQRAQLSEMLKALEQ